MNKLNNFGLFVLIVLIITSILAGISLYVYRKSGAYSLDLSRPGYQKLRQDIKKDKTLKDIDLTGQIDQDFIDHVNQKFDYYQTNTKANLVFNAQVLSDQSLGVDVK